MDAAIAWVAEHLPSSNVGSARKEQRHYGVSRRVCGNQLLDLSASEPALGLSVAGSELPGDFGVVSPRRSISRTPCSQTSAKSAAGFESRPIRSRRVVIATTFSPGGGLLLVSDRLQRFISLFKPRADRDTARSNRDGDGIR